MKKIILFFTLIASVAHSYEVSPDEREKNLVWLQKMRDKIEFIYLEELKEPKCQNSELRRLMAKDGRDLLLKRMDKFIEVNVGLFYKKN